MASEKLFIGPRLRRLRKDIGLTQAAMAAQLEISTSYLNLLERNQRPCSARLLLQLAENYDISLSDFNSNTEGRLMTEIMEIAKDPRLSEAPVSKQEIEDMVQASPALASLLTRLYEVYQDTTRRQSELTAHFANRDQVQILEETNQAVMRVRDFIHDNQNYFPELDEAAELLSKKIHDPAMPLYSGLVRHLKDAHHFDVRLIPEEVMGQMLRFFDIHKRRLDLSEMLSYSGRQFQIAYQIGMLEQRRLIDRMVKEAGFDQPEVAQLAKVSLGNYFAAALVMPYHAFIKEAENLRYDIEALSKKFGSSFEQTAHRLTNLQRPDRRGVPFFFLRVDSAGNISKRFSGGQFPFSRFGGTCPLWNIHECFKSPQRIYTQRIELPDNSRYFSIARTVRRVGGSYRRPAQEMALALGCDEKYADQLIYSENVPLEDPTPIGVNCYVCDRQNCAARAFAPLDRPLQMDPRMRGQSPFQMG